MRVAAVQMDIAWERIEENLRRAGALVDEAADRGADLVVLPEMFATGFSVNAGTLTEPAGGPIERFLSEQAARHSLYLLGTVAQRSDDRATPDRAVNAALLFGPDGALAAGQHKIHPFTLAGEDRHFRGGHELTVTRVGGFGLATAVCYDLRFPEQFRALAFRGATLIAVPANWPTRRITAWSHLLISRAMENLCYVVGVNRVGAGGGLEYDGCSAIVDPMGEVLARGVDDEQVLIADVSPERVDEVRRELPFLPDARRDLFPCLWNGQAKVE